MLRFSQLHSSQICCFYYCLLNEGLALELVQQFSISGLVAYKKHSLILNTEELTAQVKAKTLLTV